MSISQFAELAMMDKFHLAGWCNISTAKCDCARNTHPEDMFQNEWLSRREISQAIMRAEQMIADELGYWTAPKVILNEKHGYPRMDYARSYKQNVHLARNLMGTRDGKDYKSITTDWSYIQGVGTMVETQLADAIDVSMDETCTVFTASITLPDTPTGLEEYHIYFHADDRYLTEPKEQWELRDVTFSVNGTTLTITGGAYLLMTPTKRMGRKWECLELTDKNIVDKLAVWEFNLDITNHGTIQWGVRPCVTSPTGCNDIEIKNTCLVRDDTETMATIRPTPKSYNVTTQLWESYSVTTAPDWVVINYVAGVPLVNGKVDNRYAVPTFLLAASLLEGQAAECGCTGVKDRLKRYNAIETIRLKELDFEQSVAYSDRVLATKEHLNSRWGGRYGAVQAWQQIKSIQMTSHGG